MKFSDAIKYFDGDREALGASFLFPVNKSTVSKWFKADLLPYARAIELEKETKGALKVDRSLYKSDQPKSAA